MPDTWEVAHGLNPNDPTDAFTDLDGDRVPNLWEYVRGTDPTNPADKPTFDAIVDGSLAVSNPTQGVFRTLQEAYDSLPNGNYFSLVRVMPSYYFGGWSGDGDPKKVAWLGDLGGEKATVAAVTAYEPVVLISDESVLDGLEFTGDDSGYMLIYPATLIRAHPDSALTQSPELRLVNCVLRNTIAWGGPGALHNNGFHVVLDHCTLWNNEGTTTKSIANSVGTLNLRFCLVYGGYYMFDYIDDEIYDPNQTVSVHQCIIQDGFGGASPTYPSLNVLGYLTSQSTAATNAAVGSTLLYDIHGQNRPIAAVGDIGADEWLDSDGDTLPDWWEWHYFGHLSYHNEHDPDGDGETNDWEYYGGMNPMLSFVDMDRDGLDDGWELYHFNTIIHGQYDNPDGDSLSNLLEFQLGTDPNVADLDGDGDGILDAHEILWFGNLNQNYNTDFDGDGVPDGIEIYITLTNPTHPNSYGVNDFLVYLASHFGFNVSSGDVDGDGLGWAEEAALGTNPFLDDTDGDGLHDGIDPFPLQASDYSALLLLPENVRISVLNGTLISVAGPPQITLLTPPGAVLLP